MVMAVSITADSLLPWPKLDSNVGYDATVKGASVVVIRSSWLGQAFPGRSSVCPVMPPFSPRLIPHRGDATFPSHIAPHPIAGCTVPHPL
jgi:hypothetical protein